MKTIHLKLYIVLAFLAAMRITCLKAHGDLDLRIEEVSNAIAAYPDSAELYFKRGKLRFQHEEYPLAISDIQSSKAKGFYDELQQIYLAKSYFRLDSLDSAQTHLHLFLKDNPKNVIGLKLKGRILYAKEEFEESAHYFEEVIRLSIRSLPENYLEAAQSWRASTHPDNYSKTVEILELGLKNLGPIITLQNELIELHLLHQNKDMAIAIQKDIILKSRRKETGYFRLAEIYLRLQDKDNAKMALHSSKVELEKLPERIRANTAMKNLKEKINQLMTRLK